MLHVYQALKIGFAGFIILIGVLCLLSLVFNSNDFKLCVSYLKYAGAFFGKSVYLVAFVFVFYLLMAGLIALVIFQVLAFWSHG